TWTGATLAAGVTATFTLVVHVSSSTSAGTNITNTATVSSPTDSTGPHSATVTTSVQPLAELSVTKTASPSPVFANQELTYTVVVTNNGPSDAQNVVLSDSTPANTYFVSISAPSGWTCTNPSFGGTGTISCTTSTMTANTSATFTIVVHVNSGTPSGTVITN